MPDFPELDDKDRLLAYVKAKNISVLANRGIGVIEPLRKSFRDMTHANIDSKLSEIEDVLVSIKREAEALL